MLSFSTSHEEFPLIILIFFSITAHAQLGGLPLGGAVNNVTNSVVSTATGTLNSQLQNLTGFQIDGALTSLGPSRTLVFSPAIIEALSANSLPAPTAQQIGSFQGLTAATRDIGGRLAALRTGRYLTSSRNARANEFSGSKNPKSEITMLDDGRWFEILVQGDAMDLDLNNFGAADTLDLRTYAASVAVEYHPNRYQALGVAGSWTETDAQLGNGLGDTQVNGAVISAYGSWYDGPFYVDGLIAYGKMRHDISRTALNKRTAFSDTESNSLSLEANTGANLEVGKSVTGPYLSAEYTRSEIDSYSESGAGLFNIAVNDQESDSLSSDLGWQVAVPIETATGYFAPHVRVGWGHQYLHSDKPVTATLVSFPANTLSAKPVALEDDYLIFGAGFILSKNEKFDFLLDFETEIAEDFFKQAGTISLRLPF